MKEMDLEGSKRTCINYNLSSNLFGSQSVGGSVAGVFRSCEACGGGFLGEMQSEVVVFLYGSVPNTRVPQNLSLCVRRASRRMNMEAPVKAVPEAVRNRRTPQSAPFKAEPACVRKRAPPPPEGTPPQERQTWPGPPSTRPL